MTAAQQLPAATQRLGRPVGSLLDWLNANSDGLMLGTLVAAGIVGLMLVVRWVGERIVERHPGCRDWRGVIGAVLARTTLLFMVATAIEIVTSYADVPAKLDRAFGILFLIAAALQGAIWARELILGAIRARVGEDHGETTLGNATGILRVLVSVTVFALALLAILDNLGVNVTTLVAGLGIGGIAIGLAAQGIFSDLFAALSILFDRPFRRGDIVRYGTTTGVVERIGLKTTRLRALTGEQVIMSNTKLLEQELYNLADGQVRRTTIPFGLVYRTDPALLERLPEIVDEAIAKVRDCRQVRCLVRNFGASGIECELVYDDRTIDPDALARHKSDILIALAGIFRREGLELAYPTQTTYTAAPDGTLVMPYAGTPAQPPAKR
ncbi:MAG: mechanosensitive ion channel domain-containing protein [Sphingomicrobium sp.]